MRAFLVALVAAMVGGCDSDCGNPGKIDGTYAVWSTVTGDAYTFEGLDDDTARTEVMNAAFVNGWSLWDFKYVPSKDDYTLEIDGQPYTANYQGASDNCNAFGFEFSGLYDSAADVVHTFEWSGNLVYMGAHMSGTYTYSDTWTRTDSTYGTITVPDGEFRANLGEDTGF